MAHDVFIGYSRDDLALAGRVRDYLAGEGVQCYLDVTSIPESAEWVEAITSAIRDCHAFVVILSKSSVASPYVERELHYGVQNQKRFVPVSLSRDIILSGTVQFFLGNLQHIYADQSIEASLPAIAAAVRRALNRSKNEAAYADEEDVRRRCNFHREVDFTSDRVGLPVGEMTEAIATVNGSSYVLTSKPEKYFGHRLDALPVTSEFVVEVRMRKASGLETEWSGIEFGESWPGSYYQFLLSGAGALRIARHLNRMWMDLIHNEYSPHVRKKDAPNELKVVRKDAMIHFFVNGLHAATTEDFSIRTGRPGLVIGRDIRVEFASLRINGVSLKTVFADGLDHWNKLEMRPATGLLNYVAKYDPTFKTPQTVEVAHLLRERRPDRDESILIVTGSWFVAHLNDGPHAERLRDEINRRGRSFPFRWSAVITDTGLLNDEGQVLLQCPIITIGGPIANKVTAALKELPRITTGKEAVCVQHNMNSGDRRIALWGPRQEDTAEAVDYVISSKLLDQFLGMIWVDR
jgi:hypothetical protein